MAAMSRSYRQKPDSPGRPWRVFIADAAKADDRRRVAVGIACCQKIDITALQAELRQRRFGAVPANDPVAHCHDVVRAAG